ncbi:MAG TPA: S8 family serine peptidase [Fontimonas sp.]
MRLNHRLLSIGCAACLVTASPLAFAQTAAPALSDAAAFARYQEDLRAARPDGSIPNRYIVQLSDVVPRLDELGLERQAQSLLDRVGGGEVLALYSRVLYGFAVRMPEERAALLKDLPWVDSVEADQLAAPMATSVQNSPPNWGLDRIDQQDKTLDQKYYYPSAGAGAHVFILDTGIRSAHVEFTGRLMPGKSFIPGRASTEDCQGHGTHVAGIAAGSSYGVAKQARVYPVSVLPCPGEFGSSATLISGIDWAVKQATDFNRRPAVINMSAGTIDVAGNPERNAALDKAARNAVRVSDVSFVAAAGNSNRNACLGSPAGEPAVLTVASSTKSDARRADSNYGDCVDLFAPGDAIVSASHQSNTGSVSMGGTSMAAPHVAGVVAVWRAVHPSTAAETMQNGVAYYHTVADKISDPQGSPNRLLQMLVDKPPKAVFAWNCSTLTLSRTCSFDASASSDTGPYGDGDIEEIVSYTWTFGDGTTGSGKTVTHTYGGMLGVYPVTLTVTDNAQQAGSITQTVLNVGALP